MIEVSATTPRLPDGDYLELRIDEPEPEQAWQYVLGWLPLGWCMAPPRFELQSHKSFVVAYNVRGWLQAKKASACSPFWRVVSLPGCRASMKAAMTKCGKSRAARTGDLSSRRCVPVSKRLPRPTGTEEILSIPDNALAETVNGSARPNSSAGGNAGTRSKNSSWPPPSGFTGGTSDAAVTNCLFQCW